MGFAGDIREALRVGRVSARANVVPMVVLWMVAAVLEPLRVWQGEHELVGAFVSRVFFFWVGHDLSLAKAKENWPRHFVRDLVLPNYITNWCIWIPVMMAVYAFPLTLQIHLGGFAGAFWTLVFLYMGARRNGLRGSRSSSS